MTQHIEEAVGPWWRMNEPRGYRSGETGLRFGLRQSRKQHRVYRTTGGRRGNRARLTVRPCAFKEDKFNTTCEDATLLKKQKKETTEKKSGCGDV